MKIVDKINAATAEGQTKPYFSFEYFPPKTDAGVSNLYDRIDRMAHMHPLFVDVTWGAGGSTSERTLEICKTSQMLCGNETMMHMTCTNQTKEDILQVRLRWAR